MLLSRADLAQEAELGGKPPGGTRARVKKVDPQPDPSMAAAAVPEPPKQTAPAETPEEVNEPVSAGRKRHPSLHFDIQIHISPEATTDQIDQIFASMAKHLKDL